MQEVEQQPEAVQRHSAEVIRLTLEERQWDALVSSPESQALLTRLSEEIDQQAAAGEVEDGGWNLEG
jgi:hypothetical protein